MRRAAVRGVSKEDRWPWESGRLDLAGAEMIFFNLFCLWYVHYGISMPPMTLDSVSSFGYLHIQQV